VTAHNNKKILLIILHVPPRLGTGNLLMNSPTEFQYLVLTLIFKVQNKCELDTVSKSVSDASQKIAA
jgi:hypothetical protein